jgi:predicted Zn-dependent protease
VLEKNAIRAALEVLVAAGKKLGGEVHATVSSERNANTRFARNEITSAGDTDDMTVSVTVAHGKRQASASTNQLAPEQLIRAVEQASRLAKLSPEDPEYMPVLGGGQKLPEAARSFDEATAKLGAGPRAEAAAQAITAATPKGIEIAGFYEHGAIVRGIATSAGLRAQHQETFATLSMTARTTDGSGSGWSGAASERATGLDPARLSQIAIDKAVRSAKPGKLDAGKYTVVLEPAAVADLASFLVNAMDARRADEGRSFFSKKGPGTKLFSEAVTISSNPADPTYPSAPFDDEGLPLPARTWIDKGTVGALHTSRFWAAKQGTKPTGSYDQYTLAPGTATAEELVKGVKRGVLITRFWYTRWVDPSTLLITGLTRDGTFLIEDGAVTRPVNNFRFNDSPLTMLGNLEALGKDLARLPDQSVRAPALRCAGFNLASVSEAV